MVRQYEKREVTHGTSWGAFAEIKPLDDGSGGLDTAVVPFVFTGLRGVNIETSQESNPHFADNVEHIRLLGAETNEGELTCYQIPQQFLTDHLGKKLTANGGLINTGTRKNFVWQYVTTVTDELGNEYEELNIYYNVKASSPTAEDATDEDTVEPKEITIPVTASPNSYVVDEDGKAVTSMILRKTEANAALFDLAYEQIILPDTPITPVVP